MPLRLSSDELQPEHRQSVGESRLFYRLHGSADLGDLMARVIDVLIGDFDSHALSVAEDRSRNATQLSCVREVPHA